MNLLQLASVSRVSSKAVHLTLRVHYASAIHDLAQHLADMYNYSQTSTIGQLVSEIA